MARKRTDGAASTRPVKDTLPTSVRLSPESMAVLARLAEDYDLDRSNAINAALRHLARTLDRSPVGTARTAIRKNPGSTP